MRHEQFPEGGGYKHSEEIVSQLVSCFRKEDAIKDNLCQGKIIGLANFFVRKKSIAKEKPGIFYPYSLVPA